MAAHPEGEQSERGRARGLSRVTQLDPGTATRWAEGTKQRRWLAREMRNRTKEYGP
jgi:Tfp pilus assembly protein FimT